MDAAEDAVRAVEGEVDDGPVGDDGTGAEPSRQANASKTAAQRTTGFMERTLMPLSSASQGGD